MKFLLEEFEPVAEEKPTAIECLLGPGFIVLM